MTAPDGPVGLKECLDELSRFVKTAPREELPAIVGELSRLEALARLRLSENGARPHRLEPRQGVERMLTAHEIAEQFSVTEKWCYAHQAELSAVKLSGRCVRFPEKAVSRYLAARRRR